MLKILNNFLFLLLGILLGWFVNEQFSNPPVMQTTPPIAKNTLNQSMPTVVSGRPDPIVVKIIKPEPVVDAYAPEQLMIKGKQAIESAQYQQALIHIENILIQVQDVYSQQRVEKMFVNVIKLYLQQLGDNNFKEKVVVLTKAIDILPDKLQFHYWLAQLFLQIEDYPQVKYQLSFLANDLNWKEQFNQLQAQLNYAEVFQQGEVEIALIKQFNAWHIEVMIDDKVGQFVLDTGASITTISEHLIASDYPHLGQVTLSTANGQIKAFKTEIKTFLVGTIAQQQFPVVVIPKTKLPAKIDGLLGLDWLQNFDFVIDKKNSVLRLTPVVN